MLKKKPADVLYELDELVVDLHGINDNLYWFLFLCHEAEAIR